MTSHKYQSLSVPANFTWSLLGNTIYSGCQWAILIILARIGSPEIVGQFALANAICTPIIILSQFQLRAIQATDVVHQHEFADYLWLRLVASLLAFLVILIVVIATGLQLSTALITLGLGSVKVVESISDILYGFSQKHERLDFIAISMALRAVLGVIGMTLITILTHNLLLGVGGLGLAYLLTLAFLDIPNTRRLAKSFPVSLRRFWRPTSPRRLLTLAWLSAPMGAVVFILSVTSNIPRYFLQSSLGEAGVGLFSAVAAIPGALVLVINPLTHSLMPTLARLHAQNDPTTLRITRTSCLFVVLAGLLFVVIAASAGRILLHTVYGEQYAHLAWLLVYLGLAATAQNLSTIFGAALTAMRKFRAQGLACSVYCLVTFALSAIFIPLSGLSGAAIVAIASTTAQVFLFGTSFALGCQKKPIRNKVLAGLMHG